MSVWIWFWKHTTNGTVAQSLWVLRRVQLQYGRYRFLQWPFAQRQKRVNLYSISQIVTTDNWTSTWPWTSKLKRKLFNCLLYSSILFRLKQYQKVSLVCDNHLYTEGNETTDYSTIDFLAEIAPPFSQVFWTCMWTNHNHTCDTLFTPVLTEEGVCYTFNMLDRDDIFTNEVYHNKEFLHHNFDRHGWTLEDGYAKDAGKDTFPNRAMSSGQSAGMSMLLRAFDYDLDYICKGPVQGFKVSWESNYS